MEGRHPAIFINMRLAASRQMTGQKMRGGKTSSHLSQGEDAGSEQRTGQKFSGGQTSCHLSQGEANYRQ